MAYRYDPFWRSRFAIRMFFFAILFFNRIISPIFGTILVVAGIILMGKGDTDSFYPIGGRILLVIGLIAYAGAAFMWYRWAKRRGKNIPNIPAAAPQSPAPETPKEPAQ